jgi:hypothetical protein
MLKIMKIVNIVNIVSAKFYLKIYNDITVKLVDTVLSEDLSENDSES